MSFSRVADQGVMPSTLVGDQKQLGSIYQLFEVEYLMPLVTVTNEMKSKGPFLSS